MTASPLHSRPFRKSVYASLRTLAMILPLAAGIGSAVALFLWSLDEATRLRLNLPGLLYWLPLAGLGIGLLYHWVGKSTEGGTNLVIDEIHEPVRGVPRRMAPLILFSTVVTHLFGGSAGREGTAVQMGASLASTFARILRRPPTELRLLLMAGVAAGFGAVFGTPIAGAVFALEVLAIGRIRSDALLPCLLASVMGDWTCHAWGIVHTPYVIHTAGVDPGPGWALLPTATLMAKVLAGALAFGLCGALFTRLCQTMHRLFKRTCPWAPLRPVLGGLILLGLVFALGTRNYLGLGVGAPEPGVTTLSSFFTGEICSPWSWWWKLLFTAITLGSGFKGGEVTPLFFIGAALGHALAGPLGAPTDLFAGLGLVALFAAATKTPMASILLGLELFGTGHAVYIAVACSVSYLCSGSRGIYVSQRVGPFEGATPVRLGDFRQH